MGKRAAHSFVFIMKEVNGSVLIGGEDNGSS